MLCYHGVQQFGDEQQPLRMKHGKIHGVGGVEEADVIRRDAETVEEAIDLGNVESFRTHGYLTRQ